MTTLPSRPTFRLSAMRLAARLAAILGTALVPAGTALAYEKLPANLARLSPADFAGKVEVLDDPSQPAIVLTTRDGYTSGRSIKGAHADDVHLRALVDRATGKVSWQVWHRLVYIGGRRDIAAVQYGAGAAPGRADVLVAEHGLTQCPATDAIGSCNRVLRVAFELPERTVREIARGYRPGLRTPWPVRFKDANGRDVSGGLAPAEAAGLVRALDEWRRARG